MISIYSQLPNVSRVTFGLIWSMLVWWALAGTGFGQDRRVTPPVSYGGEIAPIFAMHCNSCHTRRSDWWKFQELAGEFDSSTHSSLMKGGVSGPLIVPGHPEQSLLIHRITESPKDIRMPFLGKPLSDEQINLLKTWIAQGAKEDKIELPEHLIEIPDVAVTSKGIDVLCRVLGEAYLVLEAIDPANGNVLDRRIATSKFSKDYADSTSPGGWTSWTLWPSRGWPQTITVRLHVKYGSPELTGTVFYVDNNNVVGTGIRSPFHLADFLPNPVAPPKQATGLFKYWLDTDCDVTINVLKDGGGQPLSTMTIPDISRGARYYRWNLKTRDGQWLPPGKYYARFIFKPRKAGAYQPDLAIEFTITKPGN